MNFTITCFAVAGSPSNGEPVKSNVAFFARHAGAGTLLVLGCGTGRVARLLATLSDAAATDTLARRDHVLFALLLVLIVVIGAPLVEELFFRGLFLRALQKRGLPDWAAVVGSAAVFGAVHFQLLQFVGLFAIGLVLAVMAVRTGRLGMSIATHMAFNATSVVVLYLTG